MGIDISLGLGLDLTRENIAPKPSKGGILDPDAVLVVFRTQHDDRVRPSHAALDGKVFRLDDATRPSPPIDWGCRCFLEYVAAPEDETATAVLPAAPDEPTTPPVAYGEYLDDQLGAKLWVPVRTAIDKQPPAKRLVLAIQALRKLLPKERRADARDLARMIVEAHRG